MIKRENSFGSPEDDALRRDFTINAMAFDPGQFVLIDFVGGLKDLNRQVIRSIVSPSRSFTEDPVRMLRAVRFKERMDWELAPNDEKAIRKCSGNLEGVVRHRLAEETQRFLTSGQAEKTFREFDRLGLLPALLGLKPYSKYLKKGALDNPLPLLEPYLKSLDKWALKRNEKVLSVVALLGLLTTLFDDEMTDYLRFNPLNQAGRSRSKDRIEKEFDAFFGEWGFLDTHVKPVLTILYAFRKLFQRLSNRADSGPVQKIPSGTREAWMLVVLMKPVYGLSSRQVHEAFNKIAKLPKLFISDRRLKPGPRSAAPPRRSGENRGDATEQNSGQSTGSRRRPFNRRDSDSTDQNPEEPRSSQRRSRNRRPRNRRRSPSTKVSVES
jgi:tRNA nucleotidyltransferase/poly(A) polymerase